MTYVFTIEDRKRSPHFGKEVARAATILETPPILVCGIRTYTKTPYGLQNISEAWMKDPPAILDRTLVLPDNFNTEAMLEKLSAKPRTNKHSSSHRCHTTITNQPLKEET